MTPPDTTFTPISSTESKEADEEEGDIVDISGLEERAPSELPAGEIRKEKDIFNILLLGTDERTYDFSNDPQPQPQGQQCEARQP